MKIRIKGNSLRYRLTRSDINTLATHQSLSESTNFGGQSLIYCIKVNNEEKLRATFVDQTITLFMSESMIRNFTETDQVGFNGESEALHLLVEKDFTCLDSVDEDQSDNFPNPLAGNKT
jgi:hypothetical protein